MRTAKFSELTKKQFTRYSWELFLKAKEEGHANAVLIDFRGERKVGLNILPRQEGLPFEFRAAYTEDSCVTIGSNEAFASLGYLIVDMNA
ncbi:hypothetical protein [Metapseudomonas otitidis]|uniref:hypothetical protein n=1 Tax=Metapseudomonas otitidis TaxID=319939 RepID=UPI00366DD4B7